MGTGERIATSAFGSFMAGIYGRLLRIVAGVALIAWGISMQSAGGYVIAIVGAVPLVAGALDYCVITGLLGGLWTGSSVRERTNAHRS